MSDIKPLQLAILWHMHQPDYQQPGTRRMVLPWVRLHATKDYLDMPLTAASHEGIRTTFNLVPSLLDQLDLYAHGGTDPHLEFSRIPAEQLSDDQKSEILTTFFEANLERMIRPYRRYYELYLKSRTNTGERIMPALFTSTEIRDVQVWSNLVWIDPSLRNEEPARSLFEKGHNYTEDEKNRLLDWMVALVARVVPTYADLFQRDLIDISFTPYFHPILPLLCDTDSAREALPGVALPEGRFRCPEDADKQIELSMNRFEALFGKPMSGMWPSEGSVSEEMARLCIDRGIKWIATDEEIFYRSVQKSGLGENAVPIHSICDFGPGLKIFFRDKALSDRIGFVYSGWDADRAVADFVSYLKKIRLSRADQLDDTVVSVILDGENAWEYFPNDGTEFLNELYRTIAADPEIETVTFTDAAKRIRSHRLPSLFAGSWINHNFRIWIGHPEDNAAWDLLARTREQLVQFQNDNPAYDQDKLEAAWWQIYKAEGSDWCWWYGDEHRGHHNERFDRVYRTHLMAIYELLGLDIPTELRNPIYQAGPAVCAVPPDSIVTPEIDGRLTHFYEWSRSGYYDCQPSGGAMHSAQENMAKIYFAYDYDCLYIRLDFSDIKALKLLESPRLLLTLAATEVLEIPARLDCDKGEEAEGRYRWAFDAFFEAAVERKLLWPAGFGLVSLRLSVFDGDRCLEKQPENTAIEIDVPEEGNEMFWPT